MDDLANVLFTHTHMKDNSTVGVWEWIYMSIEWISIIFSMWSLTGQLTDRRKMGEMGDRGGGCPKTAFLFATKPSFALNSISSSKL